MSSGKRTGWSSTNRAYKERISPMLTTTGNGKGTSAIDKEVLVRGNFGWDGCLGGKFFDSVEQTSVCLTKKVV